MMPNKISTIKLIECPRDAMQGWPILIPTKDKINYINALLKVGFDTIDFGSFVSPKVIPQMADTKEVLQGLALGNSKTKLLAIVANLRGASEAIVNDKIYYVGFPFSISPTFQLRNTNSSIEESFVLVEKMQELCIINKKKLVIYISMGFGNIYGDEYNDALVLKWVDKIIALGVLIISIADTVGVATPAQISWLLKLLIKTYPSTQIGVHLHAEINNWQAKIDAALESGCNRIDGALKGIGGCPMAGNALVGNIDTELMVPYFKKLGLFNNYNEDALEECSKMANTIFALKH